MFILNSMLNLNIAIDEKSAFYIIQMMYMIFEYN